MDVSDRRMQVQLTPEAKIATDFFFIRAIFAVVGFVSALRAPGAALRGPFAPKNAASAGASRGRALALWNLFLRLLGAAGLQAVDDGDDQALDAVFRGAVGRDPQCVVLAVGGHDLAVDGRERL